MIQHLDEITYTNKKLSDYNYYVMGQICVDKSFRGKGIFEMLYQKHKELFQDKYDFVVTEISIEQMHVLCGLMKKLVSKQYTLIAMQWTNGM